MLTSRLEIWYCDLHMRHATLNLFLPPIHTRYGSYMLCLPSCVCTGVRYPCSSLTSLHLPECVSRIHTSLWTLLPASLPPVIRSWGWFPPYPRHTAAWAVLPIGQGSPGGMFSLLQSCRHGGVIDHTNGYPVPTCLHT